MGPWVSSHLCPLLVCHSCFSTANALAVFMQRTVERFFCTWTLLLVSCVIRPCCKALQVLEDLLLACFFCQLLPLYICSCCSRCSTVAHFPGCIDSPPWHMSSACNAVSSTAVVMKSPHVSLQLWPGFAAAWTWCFPMSKHVTQSSACLDVCVRYCALQWLTPETMRRNRWIQQCQQDTHWGGFASLQAQWRSLSSACWGGWWCAATGTVFLPEAILGCIWTHFYTVIPLYNDCIGYRENCPYIELSLLRSTTVVKIVWLVPNFFVLTLRLSL